MRLAVPCKHVFLFYFRMLNPVYAFDHMCEDHRTKMKKGTLFTNESTCDKFHEPHIAPIILDFPPVDVLGIQHIREKHVQNEMLWQMVFI